MTHNRLRHQYKARVFNTGNDVAGVICGTVVHYDDLHADIVFAQQLVEQCANSIGRIPCAGVSVIELLFI